MLSYLSILDCFFISYLIWCFFKGTTKGLGKELEGFILSLLFLGTLFGFFVISQLSGIIKTTLQITLSDSGILISLCSFMTAIFIFYFMRKKISAFSEAKFSKNTQQSGGALIGFARGLVVVFIATFLLNHIPFDPFDHVIKNSIIASRIEMLTANNASSNTHHQNKVQILPDNENSDELIIGY
jgi:uncharacterized membrane protein required for colicin V production